MVRGGNGRTDAREVHTPFRICSVLAEIAPAASACPAVSHARLLATWVGQRRPVTASGVLGRADAREAAQAAGITLPAHLRSAADIPALHRPWVAAQTAGLLTVGQGRATAIPNPPAPTPELWLECLEAVCRSESGDPQQQGAIAACRHVLTVLATDPPPTADDLEETVHQLLEADGSDTLAVFQAFRRGLMPVEAAAELLQQFGAIDYNHTITPLGRWALDHLQQRAPATIHPGLPARQLLTRLTGLAADDAWYQARRWIDDRPTGQAAAMLLTAAAGASPRERLTAVDLVTQFGDDALPAWHNALHHPTLAAHARAELAEWDAGPGPLPTDQLWLATEEALAAIHDGDLHDAWHTIHDNGGLDTVHTSGHAGAAELTQALRDYAAAGGGQPQIHQLKITLTRVRQPVWRRVQLHDHATLGDLNHIIKILFDWGSDHLHLFTTRDRTYSDPFFDLEECGDEDSVRLARILPNPDSKITYRYDLGDCWDHEIILEKIVTPDTSATYPICLTGRGDAPIEDWNPDYPEDPAPFDLDEINRQLATPTIQPQGS